MSQELGARLACDIYTLLLQRTVEVIARVPSVTVEVWTEPYESSQVSAPWPSHWRQYWQAGADLGERMAHAIGQALTRSERVVLVGADCASLQPALLGEAFSRLQGESEVVIAPALDGGYVLIGARDAQRVSGLFRDIAWGQEDVMARTRARASEQQITLCELEQQWDVDRLEDLSRLQVQLESQAHPQAAWLAEFLARQ